MRMSIRLRMPTWKSDYFRGRAYRFYASCTSNRSVLCWDFVVKHLRKQKSWWFRWTHWLYGTNIPEVLFHVSTDKVEGWELIHVLRDTEGRLVWRGQTDLVKPMYPCMERWLEQIPAVKTLVFRANALLLWVRVEKT